MLKTKNILLIESDNFRVSAMQEDEFFYSKVVKDLEEQ